MLCLIWKPLISKIISYPKPNPLGILLVHSVSLVCYWRRWWSLVQEEEVCSQFSLSITSFGPRRGIKCPPLSLYSLDQSYKWFYDHLVPNPLCCWSLKNSITSLCIFLAFWHLIMKKRGLYGYSLSPCTRNDLFEWFLDLGLSKKGFHGHDLSPRPEIWVSWCYLRVCRDYLVA